MGYERSPEYSRELSLEQFPPISGAARPVYFETLPSFYTDLEARGYKPVLLSSLPRGTVGEEQDYLRAKLQAVEEGTVQCSDAQMVALRHSLELYFGKKSSAVTQERKSDEARPQVLDILDWAPTRHALKGNTTITWDIGTNGKKGD